MSRYEAIYRRALACCPRDFRERFGDELVECVADCAAVDGRRAWLRALLRLPVDAASLHLETRRWRPPPSRRTTEHDMLGSIVLDLRYAFRTLRRRPLTTAAILLTLGLAIGTTSTLFGIVDRVLLRPLPYAEADELVMMWNRYGEGESHLSPPDFVDRRDRSRLLAGIAAFASRPMSLTGTGEPLQVSACRATADLFRVLGVEPIVGRTTFPNEESADPERVVVLGETLWQRLFGGDREAVGKTVSLDGESYVVVGVLPSKAAFPRDAELWVPLVFTPDQLADDFRGNEYLQAIGRMKPDVAVDALAAEMEAIARGVLDRVPDRRDFLARSDWGASTVGLRQQLVGDVRPALVVLLGAVAVVLLIACANIANLLLAAATARRRELSVRSSLGASRARLLRQMLTESVALAAAGGALGLVVAYVLTRFLPSLVPHDVPWIDRVAVDPRALVFTAGLTVATGLAFGLLPAWRAAAGSGPRTIGDGRGLRRLLVVNEVALAVVLMVGAGLLLRSFQELTDLSPGFVADGRLSLQVSPNAADYPEPADRVALENRLLERLRALPGVLAAGAAARLPLGGDGWTSTFYVEGRTLAPGEKAPGAEFNGASSGYFETLGIPLLAGRGFRVDDDLEAPRVAIVDRLTAERLWPDGAVGQWINRRRPDREPDYREIVGIVGSVKYGSLDEDEAFQVYLPTTQLTVAPDLSFALHVDGDPMAMIPAARAAVAEIAPQLPVYRVRTLERLLADAVALPRFNLLVLGGFALLALILAAIGIYGVLSFSVGRRTPEIGLRKALGARRPGILGLVLGEGLVLIMVGVALGLAVAFAGARLLSGLLYGVEPTDPSTFIAIAVLLVAVALAAAFIPAWRASRLDPMVALRTE